VVASVAALLILAPMARPGYILIRDAAFAADPPLTTRLVGVSSGLPRAVPSDLLVTILAHLVGGQVAERLIFAAVLIAAGAGAGLAYRTLTAGGWLGGCAAALGYLWTPYVAERLLIGQWVVLVGYAALPWVVLTARRTAVGLVVAVVLGSLGGPPAWALVALVLVPVLLLDPVARRVVPAGLVALILAAVPWFLPAALRPGGAPSGLVAAQVFAPRADTPFGTWFSVITGGGIWNADTVPPGRDTLVGAFGAALVLAMAVAGGWSSRMWVRARGLTVAAGAGAAIALAATTPAGRSVMSALPGGGLLRDAARFEAPVVLLLALGLGAAADRCAHHGDAAGRALAVLVMLTPVAVLPALAWGVGGALRPVEYPSDYVAVRAILAADSRPGAVAVLPWRNYARFGWNPASPAIQPLARVVGRTVIFDQDLIVMTGRTARTVPGEDTLARRVGQVVTGDPTRVSAGLGRLGVRWVIVDGPLAANALTGMRPIYHGRYLSLYEVLGVDEVAARDPEKGTQPSPGLVYLGDVVVLATLLAAGALFLYRPVAKLLR
jgi:hypothetical protein